MEEEKDSDAALLLEGIVLRLQADLRWLEACEIASAKERSMTPNDVRLAHRARARQGCARIYGSGDGPGARARRGRPRRDRGEAVAVMGPSGCGKSTLLHLLGGLDRPSAGELWLAGHRVDELSERPLAYLRRTRSASSSRPST